MKGIKFSEKYFKNHYFSLFDKSLIADFKILYKSDLNAYMQSNKAFIDNNKTLLNSYNLGAFNLDSKKVKFYKEIVKSPLLTKLSNLNEMKNYQAILEITESLSFNGVSEFDGVFLLTNIYKATSLFWIKDSLQIALDLLFDSLIKSTLSENRYIQVLCFNCLSHFYKDAGNSKFSKELALYSYKAYFEYNLNCQYLLNDIIDLCVDADKNSLKFIQDFINKFIEPLKKELPVNYFLNKNNFSSNFNKEEFLNIYEEYKKKCLSKADIDMNKSNANTNLINQTFLSKHIMDLETISNAYFIKGRLIQSIKTIEENIANINQSLNHKIIINCYNEALNLGINGFNINSSFSKYDILPKYKQNYKLLEDYSIRNLNNFKNQEVKYIKDNDLLFSGYFDNKMKILNLYFLVNMIKDIAKTDLNHKVDRDLNYNEYIESRTSTNSFINLQYLIGKLQIMINTKDSYNANTIVDRIKSFQKELSKYPKIEYMFTKLEIQSNIINLNSNSQDAKSTLKQIDGKKDINSNNKTNNNLFLEKTVDAYNRFLKLDSKIFGESLSQEKYKLNLMLKKNNLNSIIKNI